MAQFSVSANGQVKEFADLALFLGAVEMALAFGFEVVVTFAKAASDALDKIREVLARNKISVQLTTLSDPKLADYVVNGMVGVCVGAAAGVAVGGIGLTIAKYVAGAVVGPLIAPVLLGGAFAGGVAGGVAGVALVHWGLTVRFSAINPELIEMTLTPPNPKTEFVKEVRDPKKP